MHLCKAKLCFLFASVSVLLLSTTPMRRSDVTTMPVHLGCYIPPYVLLSVNVLALDLKGTTFAPRPISRNLSMLKPPGQRHWCLVGIGEGSCHTLPVKYSFPRPVGMAQSSVCLITVPELLCYCTDVLYWCCYNTMDVRITRGNCPFFCRL